MRRFNRVITAALCSTICSAMFVPAAYAQTAQAEEDSGDEPIIVTATLRAMDVQDIPLAVTAVAPEALERQGINDIKNLASISPSFNIQSSQTETQGTSIKIRGVGTTGNNTGLESSVGVFIDGVYQSRPGVALGDLVDLERLEILGRDRLNSTGLRVLRLDDRSSLAPLVLNDAILVLLRRRLQ